MTGPVPHRVYQRDSSGKADIAFGLKLLNATGTVEARAVAGGADEEPWQYIGMADGTAFAGTFKDIAVGQYRLEFRISSDTILASCCMDPVFVGDLWILAGQSNMQGCGKLVDADRPQTGISCFYMGDKWGMAEEPLCWLNESVDPVHWLVPEKDLPEAIALDRRTRDWGAGLGIPFAKELRKYADVPIGLIMCAHGGTGMAQWDPALAVAEGRSFYGAMLRKVKKLGGKVAGCLWYQGESDVSEQAGPLYYDRMKRWIAQLRQDLCDAELPFIYAQLSVLYAGAQDPDWPDPHLWNGIQHDQFILERHIPRSALVPAVDASLKDIIHLDTPSLRVLGQRMAWQALRLAYGRQVAEGGPRPDRYIWNEDRTRLTILLSGINGRLAEVSRVFGFQVMKDQLSYDLRATLTEDRLAIVLEFAQSIPGNCELRHGAGFNPVVNVKDEKGIPLVVFGPILLE